MDEMKQLRVKIRELRIKKAETAATAKEIQKQLDEAEMNLVRTMQALELTSIKDEELGTFYISELTSVKIIDSPKLFDWLRSHDMSEIIKETVHHSTLGAVARQTLEEEGFELPGCDLTTVTRLGIRSK